MHCRQSCSQAKQASCPSSWHGMQVLDIVAKMLKQTLQLSKTYVMQCGQSSIKEKQVTYLKQLLEASHLLASCLSSWHGMPVLSLVAKVLK